MRMSTNMFIFAAAAGAAIGSAVTWFYAKKYYEKIANDEIDSMKEWLARRVEEQDEHDEDQTPDETAEPAEEPEEKSNDDRATYEEKVEQLSYNNYYHAPTKEVDDMDEPYVIKPEIFGEEDDYEEVSLTYYADGVLCDERDNRIEDIAGTVGEDYAEHFGDYEDDSVFVRNDRMKTDFEILKDWRNYSDLDKRGDE